jgi:hypothetical protein
MSGDGLERDLAADMPLSDEDAAAVVGGAIVKTYTLPDTTVTVNRTMLANGACRITFKIGTTGVSEATAKARVEAAGQTWTPGSEFMVTRVGGPY